MTFIKISIALFTLFASQVSADGSLRASARSLTSDCGKVDSCLLVDANDPTKRLPLSPGGVVNVVNPGGYYVECTSSGGMCLLNFVGLAQDGCDAPAGNYDCNYRPTCTSWSSIQGNRNPWRVEACETKTLDVKGQIWINNTECPGLSFVVKGDCPPPPGDDCKVDFACAKCGQVLECYVDAPVTSTAYAATSKYINSTAFCDGFKTQCAGQQCAMGQGLQVYPATGKTCPVLGSFQCKAGAGGSNGAALSNWATYQYDVCAPAKPIACSAKCDSGKQCSCKYGSDIFCGSC